MPIIKQYQLKTEANTVPEVKYLRPASAEGEGKGLEQLGGAISNFGDILSKRENQADVSDTHVALTQAQANLTNEYHQQLQDGSLDVDKFKDHVRDTVDGIEDNVKTGAGANYFKTASAELQAHFLNTAAQGSSQLAGEKAKSNYMTSLNNSSSTLLNDPSSFEFTQSQQIQGIDALVAGGGLPAEAAGKLKDHSNTELAKSAVRGWIRLDPEMAKKQLDDNKFGDYIDGDLKHQLYSEVKTQESANDTKQKQLEKQQRDALTAEQTKTQNDFLQKIQDGNLKPQDVLDSNLDPTGGGSKEQFINMIKRQNNETKDNRIQTDPYIMKDLYDRIHLPDGDPRKITDENELNKHFGNGLNMADLKNLRGEISNKGTIEGEANSQMKKTFIQSAYQAIAKPDPVTKLADPEGAKNFQIWQSNFLSSYQEGLKSGKTPAQLLNPKSSDYLGQDIDQYQRSPQEVIKSIVNQRRGMSQPPLAPGEKMIDVIDPNGRPGKLPSSKINDAKARGFKVQGQ